MASSYIWEQQAYKRIHQIQQKHITHTHTHYNPSPPLPPHTRTQLSRQEHEHKECESKLKSLENEMDAVHKEIASTNSQFREAKTKIEMLNKQKGVALRDNATSYQQSIQMESQVRGQ